MFSKIKTIIKFIAIGFLSLIGLLFFWIASVYIISLILPEELQPDYCIEDGECEEGRTLIDWNGNPFVITKEYCLENNYEWYEESKMCNLGYNEPWKVDACLDKGGCWDYIRHRCEMSDQGYCCRNKQECIERKGIWDEDKKYCNLQDN